jgi:hypothetical protein
VVNSRHALAAALLITACSLLPTEQEAPSVALTVQPDRIELGESATLTWSTARASSCTASIGPAFGGGAWGGPVEIGGGSGRNVTPTSAGIFWYALSCEGAGGSEKDSVQLTVVDPPPLPVTLDFTLSRSNVIVGDSIVLTWTSAHATRCEASGAWTGVRPLTGHETVIAATAGALEYALACTGPAETVRATVTVTASPPSLPLTNLFTSNTLTISTSEGAPYGDSNFWIGQDYAETGFGYGPTKVMRLYICLSGRVQLDQCSFTPPPTGPLTAAMLSDIEAGIGFYAGTGIRLLIRFIYNFGPIGPGAEDVPAGLITTHIDQLAPILLRQRDLIFALEAGFIGTWGEWHNSTSGNDTEVVRRMVLDRELLHFRDVFPILVRYPADLLTYTGTATPSAQLGLHDDFYASDADDGATWFPEGGYTSQMLVDYAKAVSTSSMFAGEFGALYPTLQECNVLDSYSYQFNLQSISLRIWPPEIAAAIESRGCLLSFLNKVGTRIEIQRLTVTGNPVAGGALHLALTLANTGYGRVIRPRPAAVVLTSGASLLQQTPIPLTQMDLRELASSATPVPRTFEFDITLPAVLPATPLALSLLIPDPAPSLVCDPAYALPLNSLDAGGLPVFDPATGHNRLATFTPHLAGIRVAMKSAPGTSPPQH